jgi:hypothetical protein
MLFAVVPLIPVALSCSKLFPPLLSPSFYYESNFPDTLTSSSVNIDAISFIIAAIIEGAALCDHSQNAVVK